MTTVVVLYSKYSSTSLDLVQSIEGVLDFRKLCIDNAVVRQQIKDNTRGLDVSRVPCVLVIYANGNIDLFEAADAFKWVHNTLQAMKQYLAPTMQPDPEAGSPVSFSSLPQEPVVTNDRTAAVTEDTREHTRSMSSAPLMVNPVVLPEEPKESDMQQQQHVKGVKKPNGESVQNMAAMLQAEREKEDESQHPNALSKLKA